MVRTSPAPARRSTVVAVVAVLVLLVGGFTIYQVREVLDQREAKAQASAQAQARATDDLEREQRHRTEREAALRAEHEAAAQNLALAWSLAATGAAAQVAAADAVLAESEGKVADDSVRLALAQALDVVTPLLAGAETPGDLRAATNAVATALVGLTASSVAVTQARAQWQADQDATARTGEQAPARPPGATAPGGGLGGPPSTGAGPDCGGPGSYEPPKNDGSPSFYTSTPGASGDGSNGKVPASAMSRLGWCTDSQGNGQWLRSDAAAAMTRLNEAFKAEFGENIAVDLSYRSYADQVAMREYYGTGAAEPGTSNHGVGLAVDTWEWAAYSFGSPRYDWLVANAPAYGWSSPSWARQGGSSPEYWHFEYLG